jgi:hypothetical protein
VTIREFFLENFAGDLEYHPRRGLLYPGLAIAAECFWIFSSYEARFTAIRLVFLSGGLALLLKGIFLFRKSSEGIGLSLQKATQLPDSAPGEDPTVYSRKRCASTPGFWHWITFALATAQHRQRY